MLTATDSSGSTPSVTAGDDYRTRRAGILRIVHISDLHVQANTDFALARPWPQLKSIMADIQPDFIVATGDIADRPFFEHVSDRGKHFWSRLRKFGKDSANREWDAGLQGVLSRSRTYLHELCTSAGLSPETRLRVIPGNHDYRVQGLLSREASAASTFKNVFSGICDDMLITWRNPAGSHVAFRTQLYCLDSNGPDELSNFAAGRVGDAELSRVNVASKADGATVAEGDEFRIVLMHHHPMPIAELEADARTKLARLRAITEDDRFLMLRNAGTVMRHLSSGRVHLVLHGHRHHRGYAQVAFPQSGATQEAIHRMTIVAAGSIGTSGHQFSVIDIRPPGGIEVAEWKLEATLFREQSQRTLVDIDAVRAERARQARARNESYAAAIATTIEDHIDVSSSGDALVRRIYRGLRPIGHAPLTQVPIGVGTALGYIHPSQRPEVKILKQGTGQRADFIVPREPAEPEASAADDAPKITGFVNFSPPIAPGSEIDVQVRFLVVNAHETLSEFRLARDRKSEGREYASYNTRRVPCERLIRIVRRPPELDKAPYEWRATVLRANREKDWEEWNSPSLTTQAMEGLGAFLMTVWRPLSGHNYRIEWELPKLSQLEATLLPLQKYEFDQFYSKLGDPAFASAIERALDSTLKSLVAELAKHRGMTHVGTDTVMSFMRFDRDKIELSRVTDSSGNRMPWVLVPGNGIPGQALRRNRPVLHSTHAGPAEACYYVRPPYLNCDQRFQLSLPVTYLPLRTDGKLYPILGVVSIESTVGDRQLLDLVSSQAHDVALRQTLEQWIPTRLVTALAKEFGIAIDMAVWK